MFLKWLSKILQKNIFNDFLKKFNLYGELISAIIRRYFILNIQQTYVPYLAEIYEQNTLHISPRTMSKSPEIWLISLINFCSWKPYSTFFLIFSMHTTGSLLVSLERTHNPFSLDQTACAWILYFWNNCAIQSDPDIEKIKFLFMKAIFNIFSDFF